MKKTLLIVAFATSLGVRAHADSSSPSSNLNQQPGAGALQGAINAADANPLSDLSIKSTVDFESEYVYRGKKITNEAFQPSVNLSYPLGTQYGTIGAYVWNSDPLGTAGPGGSFPHFGNTGGPNQNDEIDLGLTWDYDLSKASDMFKNFTTELGYQYYWYSDTGGPTTGTVFVGGAAGNTLSRSQEVHANLGYDTTSVLNGYNISPTLWYYHDFILDSNTLQLSLSYTWDVSAMTVKGLSVVPSANVGWTGMHRVFGDSQAGGPNWRDSYVYWYFAVEADYKLRDWCTAFIGARYSDNNDGKTGGFGGFDPQFPSNGPHQVWFGLGMYLGM